MKSLIIGATGFIGSSLAQHLPDAHVAGRKSVLERKWVYLDLLKPDDSFRDFSLYDVVYLCAGINGTKVNAHSPTVAFKTNVDGTIWIAERCARYHAFLVWISSVNVYWDQNLYATYRIYAEGYLRNMPNVGIVRAGRVDNGNIDDLCHLMIQVGTARQRCLVTWNEDEQPYKK